MNSGFFYSSADQRERLVRAERQVTTERVQKIIDLKHKVRQPNKHSSALHTFRWRVVPQTHQICTGGDCVSALGRGRQPEIVPAPGPNSQLQTLLAWHARRCATARRSRSC